MFLAFLERNADELKDKCYCTRLKYYAVKFYLKTSKLHHINLVIRLPKWAKN